MLEKTLESPLDCKEIQPIHPKGNQSWIFIGRTDAEAPLLWPPDAKNRLAGKDWCWERLKAGEGDDREWDGWMASPTQWTWVWASSGRWWRIGKPDMLQSMGSQRVGHDWATTWKVWLKTFNWDANVKWSTLLLKKHICIVAENTHSGVELLRLATWTRSFHSLDYVGNILRGRFAIVCLL